MSEQVEIVGGAGPFEAAAVVAVVDHVLDTERRVRSRRPPSHELPAWMRVVRPGHPDDPLGSVLPEHRGDPV